MMQKYKSAVWEEVVESAAKHSGCHLHLSTVSTHCATAQPFLSPRWGDCSSQRCPHRGGSTGQTVSVIPKISYRFSATIPPLFVAFEVRFQRLGWAARGGWAVTWPPPASSSFPQTINRLPTDCPIQIHQPTQLPNQRLHAAFAWFCSCKL